MLRIFLTLSCLLLTHTFVCRAAVVVYVSNQGALFGVARPEVNDPVSALAALASPPASDTGQPLASGVLPETKVAAFRTEGDATIVEFSAEIIGAGLDEARLTTIFQQVTATLAQFGFDGNLRLQVAGKLLSDYLPPVKRVAPGPALPVQPNAALTGALAGKKIALSPGHGLFWNGSVWTTQRPVYCSPLNQEDYHNLEEMQYLDAYLTQDGATTKVYRCLDKSFGTYAPSGSAWWHMAACYWIKQLGYPCTVYANSSGDCNLGVGASDDSDDIRSRPCAADYDNTDIYVSLHSNGYAGNCTNSCPTGTETYYDNSTEHATWGAISKTLATKINTALMSAITGNDDSTWTCHGTCVKDAAGSYGEIRIPDRAATLTELAFHDSCNRDADTNHLRDNFFRSTATWGMYKGICDYFGVVPTWDYYSCEVISNDIPSTMTMGSTATVHISIRNRGVLWNVARLFRLGAVGDSDPFTTTTRYTVGGEVGPGKTNNFTITLTAPTTPGTYVTDWQMLRESVSPVKRFGPTLSKSIIVTDNQPPSVPTNLTAIAVATNRIDLAWWRSTDNVGVSNYFVFRDSAFIGFTATTNYADTSCSPATTYSYQVSARDAAANQSARSTAAQATTPAPPPPILLFSSTGGTLTLTWTDGVLQQATVLTGSPADWTDVPGAASPFTPPMDAEARFFRLRR